MPSTSASWNDITDLFNKLNQARTKWNYSTVSPSDGGTGETITVSPFSQIDTYIKEMNNYTDPVSGKKHLSNIVRDYQIPSIGELITPTVITQQESVISNIKNTCSFNNGFNSSCFGFQSGFNSSCFGFNSSFDSSCNTFNSFDSSSFDAGFDSSSFDGSFDSGMFDTSCMVFDGFDSSDHGGFDSNFDPNFGSFSPKSSFFCSSSFKK